MHLWANSSTLAFTRYFPPCSEIRLTLASPEHAQMAAEVLSVDQELQKDKASKTVVADGRDVVA